MKKWFSLVLIFCLLCPLTVSASNDVAVKIDGVAINFDVPAQIIGDRTMVPMRKIFETLSCEVEWLPKSQSIFATRGPVIMQMQIGNTAMSTLNLETRESTSITLDVPPCLVDNRTLVPVRAISESLGMKVDWDEVTRTVLITR